MSGILRDKLWIILLLYCHQSVAFRVEGQISEQSGSPLPFATVLVKGTSNGTTSNIEGRFSIELPAGEYDLVFSMIGFKQYVEKVKLVDADVQLDVKLSAESYQLKELVVRSDAEDPAFEIIRKAQKQRTRYLRQVESYTCESYVKSTQRLTRYPKKFMGQKVEIGNELDTSTGIIYLSESVSKIAILHPDHIKEEMISSKVSGEPRAYSFNRGADLVKFSFYEALISFGGLAPRGIISPIAPNSIFSYKFRLEGSFMENEELIYKISVIPRRPTDPVFSGTIYLVDGSWRIHSADLFITKDQQLQFVDTFRIRQSYLKVDRDTWMPFSNHLDFHFGIFGFEGSGDIVGVFSSYNVHSSLKSKDFSGEVLQVQSFANNKDSTYWSLTRPVPLTSSEQKDYIHSDSVQLVIDSKPYQDSLDHQMNKFKATSLLTGYRHHNSFKSDDWSISSPITGLQFNTVQGWNTSLKGKYQHQLGRDDRREYALSADLTYGFSDYKWYSTVEGVYKYNPFKLASIRCQAGSAVLQFNDRNPITPLINTFYSLAAKENYMKIYAQDFFRVVHQSEWFNGFKMTLTGQYANRRPLENTTEFSFSRNSREYTGNAPVMNNGDTIVFSSHHSLTLQAKAEIRFGQRYVTRPDGKFIGSSKWPKLEVDYKKAFMLNDNSVDFDELKIHLQDELYLGMLGDFRYRVGGGQFLTQKNVQFMDYFHFNGNRTVFSGFGIDDFMGLDYYSYSTVQPYWELHGEQHFNGFILNKIPLVRKLKLDEIVSLHAVHVKDQDGIIEFGAGFEKLNVFRIQAYSSYRNGKLSSPGWVVGIRSLF